MRSSLCPVIALLCALNPLRPAGGQTTRSAEVIDEKVSQVIKAAAKARPLEIVHMRERTITLVDGPVQSWHGGNRLTPDASPARSILPASYVAGTLQIRDGSESRTEFTQPKDFVVDETWGAFSVPAGSRLKPGQKVTVSYAYSLRRVDAVVRTDKGDLRVIEGAPSADCPPLPRIPADVQHIAHVYRPFNAGACRPEHVYFVGDDKPDLSAKDPGPDLAPVIRKLEAGEAVTVVCWGDSVTVGSDAGPPGSNYVSVFESRLRKRFPRATLRVVNAGIGGTSMPGRLPGIDKEVLSHKPDLVTLEFVNDMGVPVPTLETLYAQMLKKVHESGAALIILTPHFTMPTWMPLEHGRGADPRPAVAFLRSFARKNAVPLADAARRWEQLESMGIPYEVYLRNGINHPDERGHLIFAEELMRLFGSGASTQGQ